MRVVSYLRRQSWSITVPVASLAVLLYGAAVIAQSQSTWSGVYSEEQATRGKAAFSENCATCHLDDLSGDPSMESPALVGDAFLTKWDKKTLDELMTLVKTTMPQNMPGALSDDVYRDAVAFILKSNNFPAGEQELPTTAEGLKEIAVLKAKP